MDKLNSKKFFTVLIFAFIVWALCGATMGIGMAVTTIETALIIHLIGAPIYAAVFSFIYYKKFNYTSPLMTAVIFLLFTVILDAGLVAPVFEKSYEMFESAIGTWFPFALIFISTYLTGLLAPKKV